MVVSIILEARYLSCYNGLCVKNEISDYRRKREKMKKKLMAAVLALVLITTIPACGLISPEADRAPIEGEGPAEIEPTGEQEAAAEETGSGPADAVEIVPGRYDDELVQQTKWYSFEVGNGEILNLNFQAGEGAEELTVELLNPDQDLVWRQEGLGQTQSRSTTRLMGAASGGTYYLKVIGGSGSYSIDLETKRQDDTGSGGDAGDELPGAVAVDPEKDSVNGQVGDFDRADWYSFEVGNGEILNLNFQAGEGAEELTVELLNPDQDLVWRQEGLGQTQSRSTTRLMGAASGGTYYLQVIGGSGSYSIDLETKRQDDAGSGGDAGDELPGAVAVDPASGSINGQVGDFDRADWYSFEVGNGEILNLNFQAGEGAEELTVELLNPDHDLIWRQEGLGQTQSRSTTRLMGAASGGAYYLQVIGGSGSYSIDLETKRQDDAGSGGDAGDELPGAVAVDPEGDPVKGQVGDFDGADWYSFAYAGDENIELTVQAGEGAEELTVELLNPDHDLIWRQEGLGQTQSRSFTMEAGELAEFADRSFYLQVIAGSGSYIIHFDF